MIFETRGSHFGPFFGAFAINSGHLVFKKCSKTVVQKRSRCVCCLWEVWKALKSTILLDFGRSLESDLKPMNVFCDPHTEPSCFRRSSGAIWSRWNVFYDPHTEPNCFRKQLQNLIKITGQIELAVFRASTRFAVHSEAAVTGMGWWWFWDC